MISVVELLDDRESNKLGLDIVAYKKLKLNCKSTSLSCDAKEAIYDKRDWLYMNESMEYMEQYFPNRAKPFKYDDSIYDSEGHIEYRIGSYSTYGWFRNILGSFKETVKVEFPIAQALDFIIEFSDCEGVIGTYACSMLSRAFVTLKDGFNTWAFANLQLPDYELVMSIYERFEHAFHYASEGGAVKFC